MDERSLDALVEEATEKQGNRVVREYSDFPAAPLAEPPARQRIGGWLIVVTLALLFSAGRITLLIVKDLLPIFEAETWSALTAPDGAAYHPNWAPLLKAELAGNIFFVFFALLLVVLLLMRKSYLPKLMIVYYLGNFFFVVADYFAAISIPFVAAQPQGESIREILAAFIGVTIWVPYFIVSERVKKTFLR